MDLVQIYDPEHIADSSVECLMNRFHEFNPTVRSKPGDINKQEPLLILCRHSTRIASDIGSVTNELSDIKDYNAHTIIVIHNKQARVLPRTNTMEQFTDVELQRFGHILDLAYLEDEGQFYDCEMNRTGMNQLKQFLQKHVTVAKHEKSDEKSLDSPVQNTKKEHHSGVEPQQEIVVDADELGNKVSVAKHVDSNEKKVDCPVQLTKSDPHCSVDPQNKLEINSNEVSVYGQNLIQKMQMIPQEHVDPFKEDIESIFSKYIPSIDTSLSERPTQKTSPVTRPKLQLFKQQGSKLTDDFVETVFPNVEKVTNTEKLDEKKEWIIVCEKGSDIAKTIESFKNAKMICLLHKDKLRSITDEEMPGPIIVEVPYKTRYEDILDLFKLNANRQERGHFQRSKKGQEGWRCYIL